MNRTDAISKVRKLRNLAESEYKLGNTAAGRAATVKARELMDAHKITDAQLVREITPTAQRVPTPAPTPSQTRSGVFEIKNGKVFYNGQPVENETDAVRTVAATFLEDWFAQMFGFSK